MLEAFYGDVDIDEGPASNDRPFLHAYLEAASQIRSKEMFSLAYPDSPYPLPPTPLGRVEVSKHGVARMHPVALVVPRFAYDVPSSLNYGGVGMTLVTALAKRIPADDTQLRCLSELEPRVRPDDVLALVLATETVVGVLGQRGSSSYTHLSLPGLESLWEDQLFFVALCAGLCARGDSAAPQLCNTAARNSEKFAMAFQCPRDAFMNPHRRCPFHVDVQARRR